MHHAASSGQRLHVAAAEARGSAERVGVIDQAATHDGHRLETALWVGRKARYLAAVVHAPAIFAGEVLPEVPPGERRGGSHRVVVLGVAVVVVDAEQKRVDGLPGEPEWGE